MGAVALKQNMTVSEYRWNLKQQLNRFSLNFRAKAVYRYLADKAGIDGLCWPSISTIMDECSLSRRTIIRATKDLEGAGLLKKMFFFRDNGGQTSNRYFLPLLPTGLKTVETKPKTLTVCNGIPEPKMSSIQASMKVQRTLKEAEPLIISTDANKYSIVEKNCKRKHRKVKKTSESIQSKQKQREKMRSLWEKVQSKLKTKVPVKTLSVTRGVCQIDIPRISNSNLKNGEKINILSSIPTKYVIQEDGREEEDG